MAVVEHNGNVKYEGCVLSTWEHNGSWDSDFYATVWDEELQKVMDVEYDSTRMGGGGTASVDATEETLKKCYRYWKQSAKDSFDRYGNEAQAKKVHEGDTVVAVKGRILKKGETATVFWVGKRYNPYSRKSEDRIGVEVDGEKRFLPYENVIPVNWEERMIRGRERKNIIRRNALIHVPNRYRKYFA